MRYISEIQAQQSVKSLMVTNDDFHVVVHDTETGKDTPIPGSVLDESDAIGYGERAVYGNAGVVVHTAKTARLHQYVKSVEVEIGSGEVNLVGIDSCVWSRKSVTGIKRKTHQILALDTLSESVLLSGCKGSVVMRQLGFLADISLVTLYDLLCTVCRDLHFNVMLYDGVLFHSRQAHYISTLLLSQEQDAQRFFTKMYLDAMRRC